MYAKTDRKSSEGDAIKWTKLERVMLSSHLLPHFYSCSNCKGHVKRMIGSFKNEKNLHALTIGNLWIHHMTHPKASTVLVILR